VNWYLFEIDTPFDMAPLERNPHPFGQIPCLKDGATEVFESGAILLYLARPAFSLLPGASSFD
jgi:glutathione S-transferase